MPQPAHLVFFLSWKKKSIYLLLPPLEPWATSAKLKVLNDSYIFPANRRLWYYGHAKQRLSEMP